MSASSLTQPVQAKNYMVWIDLEMTGLDPDVDRIIEVAVLITDSELEIVAHGPELAVYRTDEELSVMNSWNRNTHGGSGLIERVKASDISIAQAEQQVAEFIQAWTESGSAPLCGNSVHVDKRFMYREMPSVVEWLHYRIVDVSTLKELAQRWYPDMEPFAKQERHRAMDDIRESIDELRWYRRQLFKP